MENIIDVLFNKSLATAKFLIYSWSNRMNKESVVHSCNQIMSSTEND